MLAPTHRPAACPAHTDDDGRAAVQVLLRDRGVLGQPGGGAGLIDQVLPALVADQRLCRPPSPWRAKAGTPIPGGSVLSDGSLARAPARRRPRPAREATGRRAGPGQIEALLADPAAYQAVFTPHGDPLLRASPFLVFALALHQTAADLEAASFVPEWSSRQGRVAVFDVPALRAFLAAPARRLFLAELLASYVHVASGTVWVQTPRGWRRRRYSELDPVRLAALLEVVDEAERPGVWRRLGDLALFLTGVFPDHTDARGFGPVQASRLLRSAGLAQGETSTGGGVALLELLGRRWYRLAR